MDYKGGRLILMLEKYTIPRGQLKINLEIFISQVFSYPRNLLLLLFLYSFFPNRYHRTPITFISYQKLFLLIRDFNSHHIVWNSLSSDSRVAKLLDLIHDKNLMLLNEFVTPVDLSQHWSSL